MEWVKVVFEPEKEDGGSGEAITAICRGHAHHR